MYPRYFDQHTHGISNPWNFDPPTHGILNPLSMVFWPPYPWYFDPPTHCILNPIPMVYWTPIHGIVTYPWYFDPLPIVYWTPYPWYFDTLPMVYRTLYPRCTDLRILYRSKFRFNFYNILKKTPLSIIHCHLPHILHSVKHCHLPVLVLFFKTLQCFYLQMSCFTFMLYMQQKYFVGNVALQWFKANNFTAWCFLT